MTEAIVKDSRIQDEDKREKGKRAVNPSLSCPSPPRRDFHYHPKDPPFPLPRKGVDALCTRQDLKSGVCKRVSTPKRKEPSIQRGIKEPDGK